MNLKKGKYLYSSSATIVSMRPGRRITIAEADAADERHERWIRKAKKNPNSVLAKRNLIKTRATLAAKERLLITQCNADAKALLSGRASVAKSPGLVSYVRYLQGVAKKHPDSLEQATSSLSERIRRGDFEGAVIRRATR